MHYHSFTRTKSFGLGERSYAKFSFSPATFSQDSPAASGSQMLPDLRYSLPTRYNMKAAFGPEYGFDGMIRRIIEKTSREQRSDK